MKKQPLLLHDDEGRMKKIGGADQCNGLVPRQVLARMHNWVSLVKEVIKAELPGWEAFSSISALLALSPSSEACCDVKQAASTMATLLDVNAAT